MSGNRGGEATEFDFGLGLKMAMMGSHQNRHGHSDETDANAGGFSGGDAGGGNLGAFFCGGTSNNQETTAAALTSSMYDLAGGAATAFDPYSFKSCGALMGFGGGTMTRFTASQRQELERQKQIYKYMAASMSVPPELLIPMNSKYLSQNSLAPYQSIDNRTGGGKSGMDLRQTVGNRDAEPWRCRRTDGKKWRCSRDVAPDQKYCERHSHKGRPSRSRKLVESSTPSSSPSSPSISTGRINANNNKNTLVSSSTSSANINTKPPFLYQTSQAMSMSQNHHNPSQYTSNCRFPEWFMKREPHHHNEDNTAGHYFPQPELDQMAPAPLPRQFLDAWSTVDKTDGIGQITAKSTASNSSLLTLSMAGGGTDPNQEEKWMGYSGPGGPLAEALCLGIIGADGGHADSGQGLGFIDK